MPEPQRHRGILNRGYQIYALIDPRDNLIHYVGLSISAESRFVGHISGRSGNLQEKQWILDLQQLGLIPTLQILETIEPNNNAYALACEEELYWIREMTLQGHPLLNISGVIRNYVPAPIGKPHNVGIQNPIEEQINENILKVEDLPITSDAIIPDINTTIDMTQEENWLTTEEIAKDLKVNINTVRRWIQSGELVALDVGGEYRVSREDYEDFIQRRKTTRRKD